MAQEAEPPDYNAEAAWEQGGLYTALRAFQENLPPVKKEAEAQYGKYADLAPVTRAIIPELAKHGLVWLCKTKRKKGELMLRYKLVHAPTGQMEKGWWPLHSGNAQAQGSDMSYGRRYCLLAVTGVAPEGDDDDGQAAAKVKAAPRQAKPRAEANGQPDRLKGLITSIQIKYQELGFKRNERDDMLRASEAIIGHPLTGSHEGRTHNNLTEADARKLRDTLGGFTDRGDLLAALAEAATP